MSYYNYIENMDDILHFDIYCHRKTTWRYSKIYFFAQKKLWSYSDWLLIMTIVLSNFLHCRCEFFGVFQLRVNSLFTMFTIEEGPLWPWSYGSWIYNYSCNQFLSPLMLWVRISIRARCMLCVCYFIPF